MALAAAESGEDVVTEFFPDGGHYLVSTIIVTKRRATPAANFFSPCTTLAQEIKPLLFVARR